MSEQITQDAARVAAIAQVLTAHRFIPKGAKDCSCGWSAGPYMPVHHPEHVAQELLVAGVLK